MATEAQKEEVIKAMKSRRDSLDRRRQEIELMEAGLIEKPHQRLLVAEARNRHEREMGEFKACETLLEVMKKSGAF